MSFELRTLKSPKNPFRFEIFDALNFKCLYFCNVLSLPLMNNSILQLKKEVRLIVEGHICRTVFYTSACRYCWSFAWWYWTGTNLGVSRQKKVRSTLNIEFFWLELHFNSSKLGLSNQELRFTEQRELGFYYESEFSFCNRTYFYHWVHFSKHKMKTTQKENS